MNDELQLKQIFVKNIDEKIDGVVRPAMTAKSPTRSANTC